MSNELFMRGGIPRANDPCTEPQICGAHGHPREAELTPTNDSSDSTSGDGRKAVSVGAAGEIKKYLWQDLVSFDALHQHGYVCKN